jgi:hypothetical protein
MHLNKSIYKIYIYILYIESVKTAIITAMVKVMYWCLTPLSTIFGLYRDGHFKC